MKNETENPRKKALWYLILALYAVINAFLAFHHEPWRDEAQSWLIVRDLNFLQIIDLMNSEGHGCLWYLILYPFIKAGASVYVQNVIAVIINTLAAYLVIFKSPFPAYLKIPVVSGTVLMYYFPVIARNYALVPVLLFLIACTFEKRHEMPYLYALFVAMLVQTHVYILMAGFALSLWFLIERIRINKNGLIRDVLPLLLPLFSGILLIIELTPLTSEVASYSAGEEAYMLGRSFISSVRRVMPGSYRSLYILSLATGVLMLLTLIYAAIRLREMRVPVLIFFCVWGYQIWMNASVYNMSTQRALLVVVALVSMVWIGTVAVAGGKTAAGDGASSCEGPGVYTGGVSSDGAGNMTDPEKAPAGTGSAADGKLKTDIRTDTGTDTRIIKSLHISLSIWLFVTAVRAVPVYISEVNDPYSNGVNAAAFINSDIDRQALILTDDEPIAQAVLPFLEGRDSLSCMGEDFSYVVYSEPHAEDPEEAEWLSSVESRADGYGGEVYYLACESKAVKALQAAGYQEVYADETSAITDDNYRLFKLR
ncbi:MAG: hypothetical protein K6E33_07360 [Lachnospiraceae bacterium]|nr:hypothetical protein [Lachnospiraceae bacterium]